MCGGVAGQSSVRPVCGLQVQMIRAYLSERQKSVSRAHLLLNNPLEIININPLAGMCLRSAVPVHGLTNCLLYEETFINSHGDMPHNDECMGQQDREW